VIGWRQSKTIRETVHKNVAVRQRAQANHGIVVGDNRVSDMTNTENDSEIKNEAEERILHSMANIHDFVEMWLGSHNLLVLQKES
jgi:hypothetical protein